MKARGSESIRLKTRGETGSFRLVFFGGIICLMLWAGACRKNAPGADDPGTAGSPAAQTSPVVLQVEGESYTLADFEKFLLLNAGEEWRTLAASALSRMFDNFVEEKILLVQARRRGVELAEEEIRGYRDKLKAASTIPGADVPTTPIDSRALAEKLVVEKYLALTLNSLSVDEAAVAAFYDGHKSEFLQPERVQVSQILLDTEGRATELLSRIRTATEDQFRAVARAESKGLEASKGGLMGVFSAGQLPTDLEKAIFTLKTGEISRVVQSSYGFHIFRLDKRTESRLQSLADASPSIRSRLLDQKSEQRVAAHIAEIKAALEWKEATDKLPFLYQRNEP